MYSVNSRRGERPRKEGGGEGRAARSVSFIGGEIEEGEEEDLGKGEGGKKKGGEKKIFGFPSCCRCTHS